MTEKEELKLIKEIISEDLDKRDIELYISCSYNNIQDKSNFEIICISLSGEVFDIYGFKKRNITLYINSNNDIKYDGYNKPPLVEPVFYNTKSILFNLLLEKFLPEYPMDDNVDYSLDKNIIDRLKCKIIEMFEDMNFFQLGKYSFNDIGLTINYLGGESKPHIDGKPLKYERWIKFYVDTSKILKRG